MCGRISYESVTIIFVKVFTFLCMFWLHSKRRLFWSINLIIVLACPRGQIFGQKLCAYGSCSALNITCQQICSFLTSIWAFAPFHCSKMPKHVTSSLQMTMSKNLSMDSQIFFPNIDKNADWTIKCEIFLHAFCLSTSFEFELWSTQIIKAVFCWFFEKMTVLVIKRLILEK